LKKTKQKTTLTIHKCVSNIKIAGDENGVADGVEGKVK
jgi:hypothetical protein